MCKYTSKQIKEIFKQDEEYETTDLLEATYYVLKDGTQVSFGYDYGCRANDHRIVFGYFENIERNDFKKLLLETGMLGYCPETNEAWCLKGQRLSKEQKEFIKSNGIDLIRDNI